MSAEPLLALRFAADPAGLKVVRTRVQEALAGAGCVGKHSAEIVIAVNEACMNVIQHAYKGDSSGEIILEIHNNGDELEFCLTDFAAPVDCDSIKPRPLDEVRPGGLGTHFIREIMDDCVYGHLEGASGNFLRMRKRLESCADGTPAGTAVSGREGTAG